MRGIKTTCATLVALIWASSLYIRYVRALPSKDYFPFPNQSIIAMAPTKIDIYQSCPRVWLSGDEELIDKYAGDYKVNRLTDSRLLVEIPQYPLTLEVDGSYYDYDGTKSDILENRLRELIPLGLNESDDYLRISIWDNDGVKSVKFKEADNNFKPIREIPQFQDYPDPEKFKANVHKLEDYRELVALRKPNSGCSIAGFSLAGRSTPKKKDFIFRYDTQGIDNAFLLKVSVVDQKDNYNEIYLQLKRK